MKEMPDREKWVYENPEVLKSIKKEIQDAKDGNTVYFYSKITFENLLKEEFLEPMGLSILTFAKDIGLSVSELQEILDGERVITKDVALRFSKRFGTTTQFWINLQEASKNN